MTYGQFSTMEPRSGLRARTARRTPSSRLGFLKCRNAPLERFSLPDSRNKTNHLAPFRFSLPDSDISLPASESLKAPAKISFRQPVFNRHFLGHKNTPCTRVPWGPFFFSCQAMRVHGHFTFGGPQKVKERWTRSRGHATNCSATTDCRVLKAFQVSFSLFFFLGGGGCFFFFGGGRRREHDAMMLRIDMCTSCRQDDTSLRGCNHRDLATAP